MAERIMRITIKFKRALAENWQPTYILAEGEPGFELDTKKLKIGDGETAWKDLPYINGHGVINDYGQLEYSVENAIMSSTAINQWIEEKINNVSSRVYKGEATSFYQDQETGAITLRDENYEIINANANEIYSYEGTNYLWTGAEWIELADGEVYATKNELEELKTLIQNSTLDIGTTNTLGGVKSSNNINEINIDSTTGVMSVNSIDITKLINNSYTLILNGGSALV